MNINSTIIDFDLLASEIGIEPKQLLLMFNALKTDTDGIFPLLSHAIETHNYDEIFKYSDALQGIIGTMRLNELYELIKNMSHSAQEEDETFLYEQHLGVLKWGIHSAIDAYFTNRSEMKCQ